MKYVDIFTTAVEHFTDIPREFIKQYIERYSSQNGRKGELLKYVMQIEFPELEGTILLRDLKAGNLASTINFFNNSFNIIKQEEYRQTIVN